MLPGLDLSGIDERIQHIRSVEDSWGLPPIPDEVKLDLASQHQDTKGLGDFLWGVASDVNRAVNPFSAAPAAADTGVASQTSSGLITPSADPAFDRIAGLVTDVAGLRRPEVVDPNAVVAFKRQAIAHGLLPPGTPLDDRWDPALNSVQGQMLDDEFRKRVAGDKGGSLSIKSVVNAISEWTTPSTLLHVAEHLDLDPTEHFRHGDVSRELRTWGDKWRAWNAEAKKQGKLDLNPSHFVKRARLFLDALTGPIDDIVVPAANDLLLLTGASEIIGAARVAMVGGEGVAVAAEGGNALRGLYSAKAAFEAGQTAMASERDASFLAKGLQFGGGRLLGNSATPLGQGLATSAIRAGDAMEAWRNLRGVKLASTALGVGMRLGVAGTLEQKVMPGQSYVRDIEQWKRRPVTNSPLGLGFDLLTLPVMPPHIFAPGTLTQIGQPALSVVSRLKQVANDTQATVEVARGLASLTDDAALKARLLKNPAAALTDFVGGDSTKAGQLVTWASTAAAVDADAVRLANRATGGRDLDPTTWKTVYLRVRNSRIAQIRHLDEGDQGSFISTLQSKGANGEARKFKSLLSSPDTQDGALRTMNGLIQDHNEKRVGQFQDLLSQLQPGMVESHVSRFFKNPDDWDSFLTATDTLRQMTSQEGVLDAPATIANDVGKLSRNPEAPSYKPAFSDSNRYLNLHPDDSMARLVLSAADEHPDQIYRAWFQPLTREISPGVGRFAVAREDTVTKQDAVELLSSIKTRQSRIDALKGLEANPELQSQLFQIRDAQGGSLAGLSDQDMSSVLREFYAQQIGSGDATYAPTVTNKVKAAARAVRTADQQGLDLTQNAATVRQQLESELQGVFDDPKWSDWFGIPSNWSPDQKVKELGKMQHLLAAEVQGLPQGQVDYLHSLGYKPVHGAEFLMPQDLIDHVRPLAETGRLRMAQYSLGTFIQPTPNKALGQLMSTKLHSELTSALVDLNPARSDAVQEAFKAEEGGDVGDLMGRMWQQVRSRQSNVQQVSDMAQATGGWGQKFLANVQSSTVPYGLRDLSRAEIADAIKGTPFAAGGDGAVQRIRDAILKSYDVGFRYNGLQTVEDSLRSQGALIGGLKVLSKTLPGASLSGLIDGALPRLEGSAWDRYTRLPEGLVKLRNNLRFTLSPFFDLRRYTKGAVLGQLADLPEEARLPLFNGMRNLAKDYGADAVDEARRMFNAASRGEYGVVDDVDRAFRARGILGYSPQDYMAAANYRLVQQGVDPQRAYEATQKIYAYGTGRSPLDKSINFMFFPFSFEKKLIGASGRFLSQDLSRTLVLHDALKAYDVLNDRYDLSTRWKEYLPVLNELQKLNAFGHGISPGELGGINRPLLEPLVAPILNAFLPHGMHIADKSQAEQLNSLMKRMVPVYNDVDRMVQDLSEEGHVLFDPAHKTRKAQVDEAYSFWNAFKDNLNSRARAAGYDQGYAQLARQNPDFSQMIKDYKAHLGNQYPAWVDARAQTIARQAKNEEELQGIVRKPADQMSSGEKRLAAFYQFEQSVRQQLTQQGFSLQSAPEDVPPEVFTALRQYASELAIPGDQFESLYRKFFSKVYGPITREI